MIEPDASLQGYSACLSGSAFFPVPESGCLRIAGQDQASFLQRQTTNDVGQLAAGHTLLTVLTNPSARILDLLRLIQDEETILAFTLPGRGAETARYLKKRIFFMDKVTVEDASAGWIQVDLDGPQAASVLACLHFERAPAGDEVLSTELAGGALHAFGQPGLAGAGFQLLAPGAAGEALLSRLAGCGAVQLSPAARHVLRVEAGVPAAGAELTEDFTPLEAGLKETVSPTKGCYTGQEVIARQVTYDKITQRLVGLRLAGPAGAGERLWSEGRPAGRITSVAQSPRFGWIALAVVKRPHFEPGMQLSLAPENPAADATVVELPF